MKFLITIAASLFIICGCNNSKENLIKIEGEAQGTTWHISYFSADNINYKTAVDSLLKKIDSYMSTYLPVSLISRINKNDSTVLVDQYFIDVLTKSIEVSEKTAGVFDVTIGPLVNAWGFGFSKKEKIDSVMIDSLRQFVGYKMIVLEGNKVLKEKPQIKIDFNAIAQGYSVDVLAAYLESRGINNYLVEIGGELKAKGKKQDGEWKVGIDQPSENATERKLEAVIRLNDRALATSGNYRKFYEESGQKFSHIIDPRTGYPAKQNLLSATVVAKDGITADAYATAFMIMGLEKSKQFLADNKYLELEVFFIYDEQGNWKTYASESLKDLIEEVN